MSRRSTLVAVAAVALVVVVVVLFAGPVIRVAVGAAGRAAGYDVSFGSLQNRFGRLTIVRPDVASGREPLFTAERIEVAYALGDVFARDRLFGISGIDVERPKITIVHHRDGSYNFHLPPSNANATSAPPKIPRIRIAIRHGSVGIVDDTRIFRHSRRLAIEGIDVSADLDPARVSHVRAALALLEEGGRFPLAARGTFDEPRGYEVARVNAAKIGIAPLLDYALDSPSLHVAGGELDDLHATAYGLRDRDGAMRRHVAATARLDHFQPYLNGIAKPLRDGRGSLRVFDDGLTFPKLDGSIAGVPLRIAGGIYHLARPSLRIGVVGRGDLRRLITLADAAKHLPLSGLLGFRLLIEGDATSPTTLATFDAPHLTFARLPIDGTRGLVALDGPDTSIVRTALAYDGTSVNARGNLETLRKRTSIDVLANVAAPVARLPYGRALLGAMLVRANAVVTGMQNDLTAAGVVAGATPDRRLGATFRVNGHGVGTVGPFELDGPGARRVTARLALDRPNGGGGAAVVSVRAFHLDTRGAQPALPGIAIPALPALVADLDATVAGTFANRHFTVGGDAHAADVRAFGYPVDDVTARFAASDPTHVALDARYRGALAPIARAAGGKIAASGRVDVPVYLRADSTTSAFAQVAGARFDRATVGGVALGGLDATIGLRGRAIDVYGARVRLDGHDVIARGSFGDGGSLGVSASGFELATLRAAGLPVRGGTVSAVASIGGTLAAPVVDAGIAASDVRARDPRVAALSVDASTGLHVEGDTLSVRDASLATGPAIGRLDGNVRGIRGDPRRATYAFAAHLSPSDIGTFARVFHVPQYPEGTVAADLRVAGTGASPRIAGDVRVPEGSINGLAYRDATVALSGSARDVRARSGAVTVGESTIHFAADASKTSQRFVLHAPRVDLGDFDGYFDRGDTLGGHGSADLILANAPDRIGAGGDVRFVRTRFRQFELGDARARFATHGRTIHGDAFLGSTAGRLGAVGDVTLPARRPLVDALHRTTLAFTTTARDVDLGVWLPAAGIVAPLTGKINARATLAGRYPTIAATAHGELDGGRADRIAIHTASLDARARDGRATIANAVLAIDGLTTHVSGSLGYRPSDPLDLHLVADVPDVGVLAKTATGKTYDVSGSAHTSLAIAGTPLRPRATDAFDADRLRYMKYTVPHAHADLAVTRTSARLVRADVELAQGRVTASGAVPLSTSPFGIGPATAPLAFSLDASRVGLAQFVAFVPKGTTATGTLDGGVRVVGTLAKPGLSGTMTLADASFVGPQLRSKITRGTGALTFAGTTATLHDTHATVGGGTISATGSASVPSLREPGRDLAGNLTLRLDNPVIDAPQYLRGRLDGTITVGRAANQPIAVAGNVTATSTRVPLTAIFNPSSSATATASAPLAVTFDLGVDVGRDVRVQGGPVDVAGTGHLQVGGTLAKPTVAGQLVTVGGGTFDFYRNFRVADGSTLAFDPSDGVIPNVDLTATTTVPNPPTDVSIHITGPATMLNTPQFTSDPAYSQEQILGLLVGAQALGAVSGVQATNQGGPQQNAFQSAAEGQLGTLLTQNVLEPFGSQLGGALGLSNLAVNYVPGGGVDIGAKKQIFKNVNVVFADSFNYPQRESVGLQASNARGTTAAQVTFFEQAGSNRFAAIQPNSLLSTNQAVTSTQPANGDNGFSFSLQRKF